MTPGSQRDAGQLKLEKLKTTLIACGFRALDLLESKSLTSGEPWVCLAIIGYLFDDAFPAATARFRL
ncbi:hypothetical protein DIPPA_35401 [Diplonema papillatum]|nr:hypothetical protein DIPPA_35401 [Diplonema papillatum]